MSNNRIVAVISCIEACGSVSYFTSSVHIAPLVPANTGPESNPSSMKWILDDSRVVCSILHGLYDPCHRINLDLYQQIEQQNHSIRLHYS